MQKANNHSKLLSFLALGADEVLSESSPVPVQSSQPDPASAEMVNGKTVLITGAAGSIGSELVRQLAKLSPGLLLLLDRAETPLVDLHLELEEQGCKIPLVPLVADITDARGINRIFAKYRPHIVFHAAAYKHVPIMQRYPAEALRNNVFGTKIPADAALKYGAECFLMISTDKAVNPVSVMGASKRLAEIYLQSRPQEPGQTKFLSTRFGNVMGSNGSVVPRFQKQIAAGGPLTITNPDATRYFISIPQACARVLQSAAISKGGEIFIFDMGRPVSITELAEKMIRMAGLRPGIDIEMKITGLRPGEKMDEELYLPGEEAIATTRPGIMILNGNPEPTALADELIFKLKEGMKTCNAKQLVKLMRELLPEFAPAVKG